MTNRQTIRCAFGAIFGVFAFCFVAGVLVGMMLP